MKTQCTPGTQKSRFSPIFKHFDTHPKNTYFHSFSNLQKFIQHTYIHIQSKNQAKTHQFKEKIKENQIKIKKISFIQSKYKKKFKNKKNVQYKKPLASNG